MKKNFIFITLAVLALCAHSQQVETISVHFDSNSISVEKSSSNLDKIAAASTRIDSILVKGYADNHGTAVSNQLLSETRAKAISDYLNNAGFDKKIIYMGMGVPDVQATSAYADIESRRADMIIFVKELKGKKKSDLIAPPLVEAEPEVIAKLPDFNKANPGDILSAEGFIFQPARHVLIPKSNKILRDLQKQMVENPELKIEIQGHVCCPDKHGDGYDNETKDWRLSWNRAQYVYDFLVKNGIDKSRLAYKGFGSMKLLVSPENGEADCARNRRVEILVIAN